MKKMIYPFICFYFLASISYAAPQERQAILVRMEAPSLDKLSDMSKLFKNQAIPAQSRIFSVQKAMESRCLIFHTSMSFDNLLSLKTSVTENVESPAIYKQAGLYLLNQEQSKDSIKGICVAIPKSYYGKKWTRADLMNFIKEGVSIQLSEIPSLIKENKITHFYQKEKSKWGSPVYDTRTRVLHLSVFDTKALKEKEIR